MFEFIFSTKKIISKNQESFPIDLDDIKEFCQFYKEYSDSSKYDSIINNFLIPIFVKDWERTTNFILLDTAIQAFVPNIGSINSVVSNIALNSLNIRTISSIKYYDSSWNQYDSKITLDVSKYLLSDEVYNIPININIKESYLPLFLYPKTLNLETNYTCGYANNVFTAMPSEIKNAIAMQVAMQIDAKEGLNCESEYLPFIQQIYSEYSIREQVVGFIT